MQSFPSYFTTLLSGKRDWVSGQVPVNIVWKHKGLSSKGGLSLRVRFYNGKQLIYLGERLNQDDPDKSGGMWAHTYV